MGRLGLSLVLVVTLAVGFAVGWGVSESRGGESSDADRACAAAEELPAELDPTGEFEAERIALLNRIAAIGTLAQSTGQTGDTPDDLDELGRAGQGLARILQTADLEEYAEARETLLDACADR